MSLCRPLSWSWIQEVLALPPVDTLPPTFPDGMLPSPPEEWPYLLSPLLYVFGAAVAYWGSSLLCLLIQVVSLVLAPLFR